MIDGEYGGAQRRQKASYYIPSEQSEVEFQQSWARATPVCAPGGSLGLSLAMPIGGMGTGRRRDGFTRPDGNGEL